MTTILSSLLASSSLPTHHSLISRRLTLAVAFPALLAMPARGQTVTATLPVGAKPAAVAVNPVTNKAYITNSGDSTVTVIDGATSPNQQGTC